MTKRKSEERIEIISPAHKMERFVNRPELNLLITYQDLLFLEPLAQNTGLELEYIADCYIADDGKYSAIQSLQLYLKNHNESRYPSLNLDEILSLQTKTEERLNLQIAYNLIEAHKLTITEARKLTPDERSCIITSNMEEAWANLQDYRGRVKAATQGEHFFSSPKLNPLNKEFTTPPKKEVKSKHSITPKFFKLPSEELGEGVPNRFKGLALGGDPG